MRSPSPPYIELHCHSAYSFLDGVSLPQELAQRAGELGHTALALTDHNSLSGSMELAQAAADSGVRWELDDRLIEEPAPATALVVYRIVQEALGNVRKHAGASSVRLLVASGEGGVDVRIEDDGCGSSPATQYAPGHLGVVGMGARAEMSGGRLRVRSATGHGTIIEFWIPIPGVGDLLGDRGRKHNSGAGLG